MKKSFVFAMAASLAVALPPPDFGDIELFNVTGTSFSDSPENFDLVQPRARRPWNGPVMDISFPDPTLFIDSNGVWWAFATSSDNDGHIPVAASNDGEKWTFAKMDAMPDVGPWVDSGDRGIWAPSVFQNDAGKYVMYFSGKRSGASRCVGTATSDYPQYKSTPIRIQKVTRDGLMLQGSPKTILSHSGAADDGVIEGPAMWKRRPGSYVLFFSTHCYSSDSYDIQYAWGTAPDAEFGHRKTLAKSGPNQPIYGPGHMDIASDGTTVAFHGRDKPGNPNDTKRRLYIGKIKFPAGDYSDGISVINYQG